MLLQPEEAERFYRIWWPLLTFVNNRRGLTPDWPADPAANGVKPIVAFPVRDALWSDDALLAQFADENPAHLADDDLALALSWKHHVSGDFTVFKQLKKHAVFLTDAQDAYAVLGLYSAFVEMLPELPLYVKATLLPFEDRIIYDGVMVPAPFMLGPGIRANLAAQYKGIEESVGLITTLPARTSPRRARMESGNVRLLKAFRAFMIGSGVSDKKAGEHVANMAQCGAILLNEEKPCSLWNLDLASARRYLVAHPEAAVSVKRFARFLFDTGRGTVETVFDLQDIRQR